MRFQLIIKDELKLDLDTYCKDNGLKPSDVVRHLIRLEIYNEQSLAKTDKNGHTPVQAEEYKKFLNRKK